MLDSEGLENTVFNLGEIELAMSGDVDGLKDYFIEINLSSFPEGTDFQSDGQSVGSFTTDGWLRITEEEFQSLNIVPPVDFSGEILLVVRGGVEIVNGPTVTTETTEEQTVSVFVFPVSLSTPALSTGVEDQGPVAFGNDLSGTLLVVEDEDSEFATLSQVVISVPADRNDLTYALSGTYVPSLEGVGFVGSGTARVDFVASTRTYTISSTIITGASDVSVLSEAERAQADADIRATLASFMVELGPEHNDANGVIIVTATTTDVRGGVVAMEDSTYLHSILIQANADMPSVVTEDPSGAYTEDGANIPLTIQVGRSPDEDGSEALSVRITVPLDGNGPIGTIEGATPNGVNLSHEGNGIYVVTAAGLAPVAAEDALNSFLNNGGIEFNPRDNWAGSLTGTGGGIKIEAISTEDAVGDELAPSSYGGLDGTSKTETATAYIAITVVPTAYHPILTNSRITSCDDVIHIGASMGLIGNDRNDTVSLSLLLTEFPSGTNFVFTEASEVTQRFNETAGEFEISGNAKDVYAALLFLSMILPEDSEDFTLSIEGSLTNNMVGSSVELWFFLYVDVVMRVDCVASAPSSGPTRIPLAAPMKMPSTEPTASPSGLSSMSPSASPSDKTGSTPKTAGPSGLSSMNPSASPSDESASTPGSAGPSIISSMNPSGSPSEESVSTPGTAGPSGISSMNPSASPSDESASSPSGHASMSPSVSPSEESSTTVPTNTFPVLVLGSTPVTGLEDTDFSLGSIDLSLAPGTDPDGSEDLFIEIDSSSYPVGTKFLSGGSEVGVGVTDGSGNTWWRVNSTNYESSMLSIQPPPDYSGVIDLSVRGLVIDGSGRNIPTALESLAVTVFPASDPFSIPSDADASVGVEDEAPVAFGADLSATLQPQDNGVSAGNNAEPETLAQVKLVVPANTANLTYALSGTYVPSLEGVSYSGSGSARVAFVASTRTYTISSTILTGAADISALSETERGSADADIRATLASFMVKLGPEHNDSNGGITVTAATIDVNAGTVANLDTTFIHPIVIQANADKPSVVTVDPSGAFIEDEANIPLTIQVGRSPDEDGSETLSVRITVPSDGVGPVGVISGTPADPAVELDDLGSGVYLVTAAGLAPVAAEDALNSFLNNGGIEFNPRDNWAGSLSGTGGGIKVEAISTEDAVGDELAPSSYGGPDGTSKTETTTAYISVSVGAVSHVPVLLNTETVVLENNGNLDDDEDLVIPIGARMGLSGDDAELNLTLSGFPADAQQLWFTDTAGLSPDVDVTAGTVEISGNSSAVYTALASLSVTLADDDDENFVVLISGTAQDTTIASGNTTFFTLSHNVVVRAVADTPTVDASPGTKPPVYANSELVRYPVTIALNDTDGSETYESVVVAFSTTGGGAPPQVEFASLGSLVVDRTSVPGQVILTGDTVELQDALDTLEVAPGANNGEDIAISITATALESNPSEINSGGLEVGNEVAVPRAVGSDSFVIPVNPSPILVLGSTPVTGLEDTDFSLGSIDLSLAPGTDPDGSEDLFIEIDSSSYPVGTKFLSGGSEVGVGVTDGSGNTWWRVNSTNYESSMLSIQPPPDYSGVIDLSVRGLVIDGSGRNIPTALESLAVTVFPASDPFSIPSDRIGWCGR